MPLTPVQLESIADYLLAQSAQVNIMALRAEFPGLSVTRCDAGDVQGEVPYRRFPLFDLYLLDTREHCVRLTADPAQATGIVLAQHRGVPS